MKRPLIICALCLAASLAVMVFGFHTAPAAAPAQTRTFTLLTQEDTGSFLLQLRYGAQTAAADAGDLLVTATLNRDDPAAQVKGLASDGVAAVLLYGSDDTLAAQVTAACEAERLPLVLLDRDSETAPCVATDETQAGALAARQAKLTHAPELLFAYDGTPAAAKRLRGAADALGLPVSALHGWMCDGADAPLPEDAAALARRGACVVALTGDATLAAVRLKTGGTLGAGNPIIGADPGESRAALLESGAAVALVLPAPYTIGYRGYRLAESLLGGGDSASVTVVPALITLDNLYSPQNVKIAFPLMQ